MAPLGVLPCVGCSYRVTNVAAPYCCCIECSSSNGATHGPLCQHVPIWGPPPVISTSSTISSGDAPDSYRVEYGIRLRRLLMLRRGCLHLCSVPLEWDRFYGSGSWAEWRPAKKVEKACLPPHTDGIEVMDGRVYALEAMPDRDRARGRAEIIMDIESANNNTLTIDLQKLINCEFWGVCSGHLVSTWFARCPDHGYARCRLTLARASTEDSDSDDEEPRVGANPRSWLDGGFDLASSAAHWLGAEGDDEEGPWKNELPCNKVAQTPQDVEVEVSGFGEELDQALLNAKRHLLMELGRWVDLPDQRVQRMMDLEAHLKMMQSVVKAAVEPTRDADIRAVDEVRACQEGLYRYIDEFLADPPPCHAAAWALLTRAWPYIICMQDREYLRRVLSVIDSVGQHPPLNIWVQLAEAAAWSLFFPALEPLEQMQVCEDTAAARYVQHHLFSLLLEQRAQLQQEYQRSASDPRPVRESNSSQDVDRRVPGSTDCWPPGGTFVEVTWEAGYNGWYCSFDSVALAPVLGNSRGVALLLTSPEDTANSVFCEVLEEGRAILRGIPGLQPLLQLLRATRPRVQVLPSYLVVHARMREAVQSLLHEDGSCRIDTSLRRLIVDTWGVSPETEVGAEAIRRGAALAGERSQIFGDPEPVLDLPPGVPQPPPPPRNMLDALDSEFQSSVCGGLIEAFSPAQRRAVFNALSRKLSLVRGPPGTGKTHVAAAIIAAATSRVRVLAVTQSNAAALNLHRRLELFGVAAARVGTTLTPSEVLEQHLVGSLRERDELQEELLVLDRATGRSVGSDALSTSATTTVNHAQFAVMHRLAREADAIVMTCASSGNRGLLRNIGPFPLLVLDEAAQCVEPGALVPLGLGCQALAAVGDEKQLPATVLDRKAAQRGLGCSLFERFVHDGVVDKRAGFVQLDEQHRMHPTIAEFPAMHFYDCQDGGIQNAREVNQRALLQGFPWPSSMCHVCFVDCQSGGEDFTSSSRANEQEARCVVDALKRFLAVGIPPATIGVITGYAAQQAKLQNLVSHLPFDIVGLKIDTIDSFQGAERDLILVSTVRANIAYEVGFMRDPRRVNVLLTRARCGLVVFGDAATLESESETWRPWLAWVREQGVALTAAEMHARGKNYDHIPLDRAALCRRSQRSQGVSDVAPRGQALNPVDELTSDSRSGPRTATDGLAKVLSSEGRGQTDCSYNVESLASTLPSWIQQKATARSRTFAQSATKRSDSPDERITFTMASTQASR